jgi:hypothetical protein
VAEPDAETDNQLIQADAEPEGHKRNPGRADQLPGLVVIVVTGEQHPTADPDHGRTGDVVRDLPNARARAAPRARSISSMLPSKIVKTSGMRNRCLIPEPRLPRSQQRQRTNRVPSVEAEMTQQELVAIASARPAT